MYKDTIIHHCCDSHQLVNNNISHLTVLIIFADQQSRRREDNCIKGKAANEALSIP